VTAIRYVRGTLPGLPGEHNIAVLEGDTHIGRWVEESRRLDHDQSALPIIGKLIGPESVVYDVGAFIGDHTAFYASKARMALAIEAARDAFTCLERNLMFYPNASLWNAAASDSSTRGHWKINDDGNRGARSVVPVASIDDASDENAVEAFIRLDEIAVGYPPPTLIKLDVEGWEVRALRGAERTIRNHHPIIVCEVNRGALVRAGTSPEELHALLTGHGYEMRDLFTDEAWQPGDGRDQFDVVARVR
jgi:FkbM family methyltransferase